MKTFLILFIPLALGLTVTRQSTEHVVAGSLLMFNVDSNLDEPDKAPGDGVCETASHHCTPRAAVMEANAHPGPEQINLPANTYKITIPPHDATDTNGRFLILTDQRSGATQTARGLSTLRT